MAKQTLFQYAVLWHPNEQQSKDGAKSKILVNPTVILSTDMQKAQLTAAMSIPEDSRKEIDQIEIAVTPF